MNYLHFEKRPDLQMHKGIVAKHRKAAKLGKKNGTNPVVTLVCAGGCNQTQRVRASKIREGVIFLCDHKATRHQCQRSIPRAVQGKCRTIKTQQAGGFSGVIYEDKGPLNALACAVADVGDTILTSLTRLGLHKD